MYRVCEPAVGEEGLAPAVLGVVGVQVGSRGGRGVRRGASEARGGKVAEEQVPPELRLRGQGVEVARDEAHASQHAADIHERQHVHPHLPPGEPEFLDLF